MLQLLQGGTESGEFMAISCLLPYMEFNLLLDLYRLLKPFEIMTEETEFLLLRLKNEKYNIFGVRSLSPVPAPKIDLGRGL